MAIVFVVFAVILAVWFGLFNDIIKHFQKVAKVRKAWKDKSN